MEKEEKHEHPSFGQISFSRVTCHPSISFYGSELPQDHYITMELRNSEINRELTQDRYYPKGVPIVKIRMTSGQFAEMITSMNYGSGVCCTIERQGINKIEDLPMQESRKEFVHRKFEERMESKDDMHQLQMHLEWLTGEIERNIPFFAKCFQETMDEVVFEAKTEVENAIQHKINILGLSALHDQNQLLENK